MSITMPGYAMRPLLLSLILASVSVAQPRVGDGYPPIDTTTGQGVVDDVWVRSGPFSWLPSDYLANVGSVTWYFVSRTQVGGEITVTKPDGTSYTTDAPTPVIRKSVTQMSSVASATGVKFTGFTGGAAVTGTFPKAGDPYVGVIRGGGVGWTARWSKPGAPTLSRWVAPYEIFGVIGATMSPKSMSYW